MVHKGTVKQWGQVHPRLVVDLPQAVFEENGQMGVAMFDATYDLATQTITVTYSAKGQRRIEVYEPGLAMGHVPILVEQEIQALGWKVNENVQAECGPSGTLKIWK